MSINDIKNKLNYIVIYNDKKGTEDTKTNIASSESFEKTAQKLKAISLCKDLDIYRSKFKLDELKNIYISILRQLM